MKYLTATSLILLLGLASSNAADFDDHHCSAPVGITLQVPGSGGPIADDRRASTAYLAGYLQGRDGLIKLDSVNIDASLETSSQVYNDPEGDIGISALGVPHGPVPALAYKIRIGQKSLVFSGDQNGSSEAFLDFASGTDVLVMHMPVPENISGTGRKLHAPPSIIGKIAAKTGASTLVLSHFMARSLESLEGNLVQVRNRYKGSLVVADDLDCIGV